MKHANQKQQRLSISGISALGLTIALAPSCAPSHAQRVPAQEPIVIQQAETRADEASTDRQESDVKSFPVFKAPAPNR